MIRHMMHELGSNHGSPDLTVGLSGFAAGLWVVSGLRRLLCTGAFRVATIRVVFRYEMRCVGTG